MDILYIYRICWFNIFIFIIDICLKYYTWYNYYWYMYCIGKSITEYKELTVYRYNRTESRNCEWLCGVVIPSSLSLTPFCLLSVAKSKLKVKLPLTYHIQQGLLFNKSSVERWLYFFTTVSDWILERYISHYIVASNTRHVFGLFFIISIWII